MDYKLCEQCGAALDPEEKCDCANKKAAGENTPNGLRKTNNLSISEKECVVNGNLYN